MDLSIVKGVSRNCLTMQWVKIKTLGKGSYGVVHLVKTIPVFDDISSFAVKSCLYEDSSSLQKELEILKKLDGCDNIVKSYGDLVSVNHQGKLVYNLFLEYAPGGNFLNLMLKKYGGKIPECKARWYTRMLLEGVRDIHHRGYVHCDLKPENILVFPPNDKSDSFEDCRLKIADFGLVRRHEDIAEEPFPGTTVYMSPESVADGEISFALDIWSLGCIVLEMITGQPPWATCQNNMSDLYIKIGFSECTPEIPETMSSTGKDFLIKCFKRDPSERWTADMLLCHPFFQDCLLPAPAKSLRRKSIVVYYPSTCVYEF